MANVHLDSNSLDCAVFCLSLMGTNTPDFIKEAWRCLKPSGTLMIAEVISRMSEKGKLKDGPFIEGIERQGFKLIRRRILSKMFIMLDFRRMVRKLLLSMCSITISRH